MSSPPAAPKGMTLAEFGQRLWGTGPDEAQQRLATVTRDELIQFGLTPDLARRWRDFYFEQAIRGRGLPTAPIRVQLLEKCVELLG